MSKVNVINNIGEKVNITVNRNSDKIEIIIDLANTDFKLSKTLKPGDTFKDVDGDEYILWYYLDNGDAVILRKENLKYMEFGKNNNYYGSNIDKYLCDTYLPALERKFGAENIVEHEVDLLSLDGEDDYGMIVRKVSIPTLDQYRMNKKTIKKYLGKLFWLCTPNSTPSGYGAKGVRCVNSDGSARYDWCSSCMAVRPSFVLNSSIFES